MSQLGVEPIAIRADTTHISNPTAAQTTAAKATIAYSGHPVETDLFEKADGSTSYNLYFYDRTVLIAEDGTVGFDGPSI